MGTWGGCRNDRSLKCIPLQWELIGVRWCVEGQWFIGRGYDSQGSQDLCHMGLNEALLIKRSSTKEAESRFGVGGKSEDEEDGDAD